MQWQRGTGSSLTWDQHCCRCEPTRLLAVILDIFSLWATTYEFPKKICWSLSVRLMYVNGTVTDYWWASHICLSAIYHLSAWITLHSFFSFESCAFSLCVDILVLKSHFVQCFGLWLNTCKASDKLTNFSWTCLFVLVTRCWHANEHNCFSCCQYCHCRHGTTLTLAYSSKHCQSPGKDTQL